MPRLFAAPLLLSQNKIVPAQHDAAAAAHDGTRMRFTAREHEKLLADWERMLEDGAKKLESGGALDTCALMQVHFPRPHATYEIRIANAISSSKIETMDLQTRADRGEWVWG